MSFARSKKSAPAPQDDGPEVTRCHAIGCPCRGSVRVEGGRWTCGTHAFSAPDDWPRLTEGLLEHRWLLDFIDGLLTKPPSREPEPDWRGLAVAFWSADPFGAPRGFETRRGYEYRMREELRWRLAGQRGTRPEPKDKRPAAARTGGNVAAMAGFAEAA